MRRNGPHYPRSQITWPPQHPGSHPPPKKSQVQFVGLALVASFTFNDSFSISCIGVKGNVKRRCVCVFTEIRTVVFCVQCKRTGCLPKKVVSLDATFYVLLVHTCNVVRRNCSWCLLLASQPNPSNTNPCKSDFVAFGVHIFISK